MVYKISDALPLLEDLMTEKKLSILAGSGVSIDSGLPTWDGLIDKFIYLAESIPFNSTLPEKKLLDNLITDAKLRKKNNRFDPIAVATTIKKTIKILLEKDDKNPLAKEEYNSWIATEFTRKSPNEYHNLIVTTDFQFILTTNYDTLFEKAALNNGIYNKWPSYSFKNAVDVMSSIHSNSSSIIHIHGRASELELDELVFTKEDYNKMIFKKYDGFSFALRMFFTRYSTLFIGYGASDPHLDEVFEELAEYFPLNEDIDFKLPNSYLIMKKDKIDSVLETNLSRLRIHIISIDDYSDNKSILEHLNKKFPK